MFWNEVDEALVLPAQGYKLEALAGTCLADASVRDGAQFEGELVLYYVFCTTIPLRGSPKMVTALQVWQWSGGESGLDCDDSGLDLHSTD